MKIIALVSFLFLGACDVEEEPLPTNQTSRVLIHQNPAPDPNPDLERLCDEDKDCKEGELCDLEIGYCSGEW